MSRKHSEYSVVLIIVSLHILTLINTSHCIDVIISYGNMIFNSKTLSLQYFCCILYSHLKKNLFPQLCRKIKFLYCLSASEEQNPVHTEHPLYIFLSKAEVSLSHFLLSRCRTHSCVSISCRSCEY